MATSDVDDYLAGLGEAERDALQQLRLTIRELLPDAEECMSYGKPAFKVDGKTVAGFAAFTDHLSFLPHSGSVLSALGDDVAGYRTTKGALHFSVDSPLPATLVKKLISTRMNELESR